MQRRRFGTAGLEVSLLGLGAGQLDGLDEEAAARLILGAVDLGVSFIDTARGYGASEERIGRHLGPRRREVVLSTKGGYGVEGVADWTGETVRQGVERALRVLRTDYLDVFHLHSCPKEVLGQEELLGALEAQVREGKVRVAAYSGENEALGWAVESGRFGAVQCSINPFDQRALGGPVRLAAGRLGVIGKRPLGNAPWAHAERPAGEYVEPYWERWRRMASEPELAGLDWPEVTLRFGAFSPGVSTVIVGTRSLEHLRQQAERLDRGPLEPATRTALERAFASGDAEARLHGGGWEGQV